MHEYLFDFQTVSFITKFSNCVIITRAAAFHWQSKHVAASVTVTDQKMPVIALASARVLLQKLSH